MLAVHAKVAVCTYVGCAFRVTCATFSVSILAYVYMQFFAGKFWCAKMYVLSMNHGASYTYIHTYVHTYIHICT